MTDREIAGDLSNKKRLKLQNLLDSRLGDRFSDIASAINSSEARQILYHYFLDSYEIPRCVCGNRLKWHPDLRQYRKYCSVSCTAKYSVDEKKQKNLVELGVEWHSQTKSWREQIRETSLSKFGVEHYAKSQDFLDRVASTSLARFGVDHPMRSDRVRSKLRETNLQKYGVDNPIKSPAIKEKIKKTNQERYGFENPLSSPEVKERVSRSNLERYGYFNPASSPEIRKKIVETLKQNHYRPDTLIKIQDPDYLRNQHHDLNKPIWKIADDLGVSASNLSKYFQKYDIPVIIRSSSSIEEKIKNHYNIQQVVIEQNVRHLIHPKEIDLYFPDHLLGIEINGCYWHSEKYNKDKNYHLRKTDQIAEKGMTLLQFWDIEIEESWEKIINIIDGYLGFHQRLAARKTTVVDLSSKEKSDFLGKNHLQGDVNSRINLGLRTSEGELVMVATFGVPRFTKKRSTEKFELLRLCSKKQLRVVGGAGKLFKYFVHNHLKDEDSVISYCDRRYSQGDVYRKLGFELRSISPPGFFYIDQRGNYSGTRYQWQKHLLKDKLENFDPGLTADENMKNHGYEKVWDCGQLVFSYTKNPLHKENNII